MNLSDFTGSDSFYFIKSDFDRSTGIESANILLKIVIKIACETILIKRKYYF